MKCYRFPLPAALSLGAIALSALSFTFSRAQEPVSPRQEPSSTAARYQSSPADQTSDSNALRVAAPDAASHSMRSYAGRQVAAADGEKQGTITDFAVDPKSGRIDLAVVDTGDSLILVPWEAMHHAGVGGFIVSAETVAWADVPSITRDEYNSGRIDVSAEDRTELGRHFGPSRHRANDGTALACATALQGKSLRADGKDVGKIDALVVDADTGIVAALVAPSSEFAASDSRFLVPLGRLDLSEAQGDVIVATLGPGDFAQARPNLENVAASTLPPSPTPPDESTPSPLGRTEVEQSPAAVAALGALQAIRKALDGDPSLSAAAIRVTQEDGKLVLRGAVDSEQAKQNIERAAREAAAGLTIDSQVTVQKP